MIVKRNNTFVHGNAVVFHPCMVVLLVSAAEGNADMKDAAAAKVKSVSCMREEQEETQLSAKASHTQTGLSQRCLAACATFLSTAVACTALQMRRGHDWSCTHQGLLAVSRNPCLRGSTCTCRPTYRR